MIAMFKAVLFDLDNTLIDFMKMKRICSEAAVSGMIEAGLGLDQNVALKRLFEMYDKYGIEDQEIFDNFLKKKKRDYEMELNPVKISLLKKSIIPLKSAINISRML